MSFIGPALAGTAAIATGGTATAAQLGSMALVAASIGAGVTGAAAIAQARQQEDALEAAASATEMNARIESEQERRRGLLAMGLRRATSGASGFDPNTGTPLGLLAQLASQIERGSLGKLRGTMLEKQQLKEAAVTAGEEGQAGAIAAGIGLGDDIMTIESRSQMGAFGQKTSLLGIE